VPYHSCGPRASSLHHYITAWCCSCPSLVCVGDLLCFATLVGSKASSLLLCLAMLVTCGFSCLHCSLGILLVSLFAFLTLWLSRWILLKTFQCPTVLMGPQGLHCNLSPLITCRLSLSPWFSRFHFAHVIVLMCCLLLLYGCLNIAATSWSLGPRGSCYVLPLLWLPGPCHYLLFSHVRKSWIVCPATLVASRALSLLVILAMLVNHGCPFLPLWYLGLFMCFFCHVNMS